MDNEDFLKRLSEVADWHRPKLGPSGCNSIAKGRSVPEHPGEITEQELAEMSDEEAQEYYDKLMAWRESQPNDSVPPEIKRLKFEPRPCDDCSQMLEQHRRTERKLYISGQRHWRERCLNCNKFRHPDTGKFTVNGLGSHQFFCDYYRPKLGVYRSKYQPEPKNKPKPDIIGFVTGDEPVRAKKPVKIKMVEVDYKLIQNSHGDNIVLHPRKIILPENWRDK